MADPKTNDLMERIVSLCKRRGFVFQSSEIYGGINGFWDYGPLGAELKRNIKDQWWRTMTQQREDIAGLEATIIMSPRIWEASGHVQTFADLMVECPVTKKRYRADQVEESSGTVFKFSGAKDASGKTSSDAFEVMVPAGKPKESALKVAKQFYQLRGLPAPEPVDCGEPTKVENSTLYSPENGARLTDPRPFNLMFKTFVGPVESEDNVAYLRPETAQAIFAQFKNVLETSRQKVPFGICQIGKAFRNEVTPRNFTFRSREFEQMELEFFIRPDEAVEAICGEVAKPAGPGHPGEPQTNWGWQMWHQYWVEERIRFYENIGLPRTTLVEYWQKPEELAHYARATVDILFKFPFSKKNAQGELMGEELEGVAARSDFDLSQHQRFSGKSQGFFDQELKEAWPKLSPEKQADLTKRYYETRYKYLTKTGVATEQAERTAKDDAAGLAKGNYIPHVIEPSAGVDRLMLALICNAYGEELAPDEKGKMEQRVVLKFHPRIAPIKVAVFPLLKNRPELVKKAMEVRDLLRPYMTVFYDEAGAIGRRYRRQDEAGTPFGITIDFETLGENAPDQKDTVTLRDRDTMSQTRVNIKDLLGVLLEKVR